MVAYTHWYRISILYPEAGRLSSVRRLLSTKNATVTIGPGMAAHKGYEHIVGTISRNLGPTVSTGVTATSLRKKQRRRSCGGCGITLNRVTKVGPKRSVSDRLNLQCVPDRSLRYDVAKLVSRYVTLLLWVLQTPSLMLQHRTRRRRRKGRFL